MEHKQKISRQSAVHVLTLMLACIFIWSAATPAYAAGAQDVSLPGSDTVVGMPFSVENMFPGDSVVQEYIVSVAHTKAIMLYYHTDIHAGHEILAEVLKTKIELADKGITLYDGLMRDMPAALEYPLPAGEDSLRYRITVYLDTSVGSSRDLDLDGKRYMNRQLTADFRWWYLEEEPAEPAPVYVKLTAEKTVNGKHPKGKDYTFLLGDAQMNTIQTKRNNKGLIEFDSLRFDEPGTYTFYMTEKDGGKARIVYDDSVYSINIAVTQQDDVLTAAVSYYKDGQAYTGTLLFANISHSPITGDDTPLGLYIGLAAGALLVIGLLIVMKTRNRGRSE
jgi:pilin isopeptide linkage protein